jgi:transcriptional regulator with XRE-family HTH domain
MEINTRKLERERKKLGLTKEKFARHIGLVPSGYTYVLQKKSTTLDKIDIIADKLFLDPKDLLI